MKFFLKLLIPALGGLLLACDSMSVKNSSPQVFFTQPFSQKNISAKLWLGKNFVHFDAKDTFQLDLEVDKKTSFTYFLNQKTKDTLMYGLLDRKKGVYFLSQPAPNGLWRILWFYKEKGQLCNFGEAFWQSKGWGETYIDRDSVPVPDSLRADSLSPAFDIKYRLAHEFRELTVDSLTNENQFVVKTDAKALLSYIDRTKNKVVCHDYKRRLPKNATENENPDTNAAETAEDAAFSKPTLFISPNPAKGSFEIWTEGLENYRFELLDFNGKVVFSGNYTEKEVLIDVTGLPRGLYRAVVRSEKPAFQGSEQVVLE